MSDTTVFDKDGQIDQARTYSAQEVSAIVEARLLRRNLDNFDAMTQPHPSGNTDSVSGALAAEAAKANRDAQDKAELSKTFGPTSSAKLAQELMSKNPDEYRRRKVRATELGLLGAPVAPEPMVDTSRKRSWDSIMSDARNLQLRRDKK